IEAGVQLLVRNGVHAVAPFNAVLAEMLWLEPAKFAAAVAHVEDVIEREQMLSRLANDFHAGFFETSMALHCAPESVSPDYRSLPPCHEVRPHPSFLLAAKAARTVGAEKLARELTFAAEGL